MKNVINRPSTTKKVKPSKINSSKFNKKAFPTSIKAGSSSNTSSSRNNDTPLLMNRNEDPNNLIS